MRLFTNRFWNITNNKRILFLYESSKYSNALITYLKILKTSGYEIRAVITDEWGPLSDELKKLGIKVYMLPLKNFRGITYYFFLILYLVFFIIKHKISIIHSHVQKPNFIATLTSFIVPVKLFAFRHHYRPFGIKMNWKEKLFDWFIHKFAGVIIVPSKTVREGIIKYEGFKERIVVVPYIYDFLDYNKPDMNKVKELKEKYHCKLRLIMVSRLITLKRPFLVLKVVRDIIAEGYDIKLLVAGDGPLRTKLENWVYNNNLQDCIVMLGFKKDLINYMAACDMLVSASMTDASNSAAKEMGLLGKLIAVPDYVGDFTEYVIDGWNGFLLPLHNTEHHLKLVIKRVYENSEKYNVMGERLRETILKRFDYRYAKKVVNLYKKLG